MKKSYGILICVLCVVMMAGCSKHNPETPKTTGYISASWSKSYANLQELTQDSDLIAIVSVKDVAKRLVNKELPSTVFTVCVETAVSGSKVKEEILIYMTGGSINGKQVEIIDDPLMKAGEEYLLFCRKNADGTYTVLGGPQGRFVYSDGRITSLHIADERVKQASAVTDIALENADCNTVLEQIKTYLKPQQSSKDTGQIDVAKATLTE